MLGLEGPRNAWAQDHAWRLVCRMRFALRLCF